MKGQQFSASYTGRQNISLKVIESSCFRMTGLVNMKTSSTAFSLHTPLLEEQKVCICQKTAQVTEAVAELLWLTALT